MKVNIDFKGFSPGESRFLSNDVEIAKSDTVYDNNYFAYAPEGMCFEPGLHSYMVGWNAKEVRDTLSQLTIEPCDCVDCKYDAEFPD